MPSKKEIPETDSLDLRENTLPEITPERLTAAPVHTQLEDLQKVVVSQGLDGLEKKLSKKPVAPFLAHDIQKMPGKETKEYKEIADEFQSFEAACALFLSKLLQSGIPITDLEDLTKLFAPNFLLTSLTSEQQAVYKKLSEIYNAGSISPYFALFFGKNVWKDALTHIQKSTKVVQQMVEKTPEVKTVENTPTSTQTPEKKTAVSMPEKMMDGVKTAGLGALDYVKNNPGTSLALAAGGYTAIKLWKWMFAPKQEESTFSSFSSIVKWGGLAGGSLLLMSQYPAISTWVTSLFEKGGTVVDTAKVGYEIVCAMLAGDWNKVANIIAANREADPKQKLVYDAMEKASSVDRNYLVLMSSHAYGTDPSKGFFEGWAEYFKGVPAQMVDAGKQYFLGFSDKHQGKLLNFLDTHKDFIAGLSPKPKTYLEVYQALYTGGKLDGVAHTSDEAGVVAPSTEAAPTDPNVSSSIPESEKQGHKDDNVETFAPLAAVEGIKTSEEAKKIMEELQKNYFPDKTLQDFIDAVRAKDLKDIDLSTLITLQKNRKEALDELMRVGAKDPFDADDFMKAAVQVQDFDTAIRTEFKNVYALAHKRNVWTQAMLSSSKFLRFVNAYERYTRYPAIYNYTLQKVTVAKVSDALGKKQVKSTNALTVKTLEAKKLQGPLTVDEDLKLKNAKVTVKDKSIQQLEHLEEVHIKKIDALELDLSNARAANRAGKLIQLDKLKNEKELLTLEKESKFVERDLKKNPTDPRLISEKKRIDTEMIQKRSMKLDHIQSSLNVHGQTLDSKAMAELDTFKTEVKKQRKALDKMHADIYQESRALKGKTTAEIAAARPALILKYQDWYSKQTQIQSDIMNKFRTVTLGSPSANVVNKMKEWVKDVGIVQSGKKLITTKNKFAIFGATVVAGTMAGSMTSSAPFTDIAKETFWRLAPVSGSFIDLYEGVTGTGWFNGGEKLDTTARALSVTMGLGGALSDITTVIPLLNGVGIAGRVALGAVKTGSFLKILSKADKLEETLKVLEGLKTSENFIMANKTLATAGTAATAMSLLTGMLGINLVPKIFSEIEMTPLMKDILGDKVEEAKPA